MTLADSCEGENRMMAVGVSPACAEPVLHHGPLRSRICRGAHARNLSGLERPRPFRQSRIYGRNCPSLAFISYHLAMGDGPYMVQIFLSILHIDQRETY